MRVFRTLTISLLTLGADTDKDFCIDILCIETADWFGSMFHLSSYDDTFSFDFLWMRKTFFRLQDWIEGN